MTYKTLSTALGQAGAGYMRGRQYREQISREEKERRLREESAERLRHLRKLLGLKPTETAYGTTSPIDMSTLGPAQMPATMETPMGQIGWATTPRAQQPQPKKLTPREKAELDWEFDKKKWDYQLANPKATAGGRGRREEIISAYQKALTTLSNMQDAARKLEADDKPIPPWLQQGIRHQLDLVLVNQDEYYRATGMTDPRMGINAPPESYAANDSEWFTYLGNAQRIAVEKRGKPFTQAEINQLKQEYLQALGE